MKKLLLLPIICLFIIMMADLVSATVTTCIFDNPGAADTLTGTIGINVTCSGGGRNASNCTIIASSSASGGSLTSTILYNSTEGNWANVTLNTKTSLRDATDWSFSGSCRNSTNDVITLATRSSIIVNNGVPGIAGCTIDGSTASNTTVEESSVDVACTVQNATTCNAYWKDTTANAMATDYSDIDCTFTASSSYGTGFSTICSLKQISDDYETWYYDCTDGTDTTTSTHYEIKLVGESKQQKRRKGEGITMPTVVTDILGDKRMMVFILLLFAVLLLLIAAYLRSREK